MKFPDRRSREAAPPPALVNIEAERAVLGRVLLDDRQWYDVADRLNPGVFADERHRAIFRGMKSLVDGGRGIGLPTLVAQIGDEDGTDVTLPVYLAGLRAGAMAKDIASAQITEFVDVLLHRAGCRDLIEVGDRIKDYATTAALDAPIEHVRAQALALIVATDDGSVDGDAVQLGDLVGNVIRLTDDIASHRRPPGMKSGLRCFDELVGAITPGQVIVIAGQTSSGKTAAATELGVLFAQQGVPVHMASLEMDSSEIAARVLATFAGIPADRIIEGAVSAADIDTLMTMGERAVALPFWIDSRPRQTVSTLQARFARAQRKFGVRLGIIDHLQYIRSDNPKAEEREQIRQVADDVKAMAKRLQMPIFLLSHVSRSVDFGAINRAADIRRPVLGDLYGSSAIEKSADAVVFVHRPSWFLERATPATRWLAECEADKLRWEGRAEMLLLKRRGGRGYGVRECLFNEQLTWFSDFSLQSFREAA